MFLLTYNGDANNEGIVCNLSANNVVKLDRGTLACYVSHEMKLFILARKQRWITRLGNGIGFQKT